MAASATEPLVICRSTAGLYIYRAADPSGPPFLDLSKESVSCYCMKISTDGKLLAWATDTRVQVYSFLENKSVFTYVREKPVSSCVITVSPRGTCIAAWTPATGPGQLNLHIWDICTGKLLANFEHRKAASWEPKWSANETVCIRNVNNELLCYEKNDFSRVVVKVSQRKVADFSIGACGDQCMVAVFERGDGAKNQPDFVRLYKYPQLTGLAGSQLAMASFFNGHNCILRWNSLGSCVLAIKMTETSSTSYYGDQTLHFLTTVNLPTLAPNNSCLMNLEKKGPIPDAAWSPSGKEFCVIYGAQPARAALYGLRLEKLCDFGEGSRNIVCFNQQATKLCLAGFGSIRGKIQVWDLATKRITLDSQDSQACDFEWCPDGEHYMTTITTPKLKVNNRFWIFSSDGGHVLAKSADYGSDLFDATWRPEPGGTYSVKAISARPLPAAEQPIQPSKQVYVPPHKSYGIPGMAPGDRPKSAKPSTPKPVAPKSSGDENEKALKKLNKKLEEIQALKEKQAAGAVLERNQLTKLNSESDILRQIDELSITRT